MQCLLTFIFLGFGVSRIFCNDKFEYECEVLQRLEHLEDKSKTSDADIENLRTSNEEIDRLKVLVDQIEDDSKQYSAFNAHLKSNTADLVAGTTVVFDEVHLNVGNNYDPHHGVFTATIRGLYFFTMETASPTSTQAWLMKNGNAHEYTFTPGSGWQTGSASVILQLEPQDRVSVGGKGVIQGYDGHAQAFRLYHSSFTGHLIKAL